MNTQTRITTPNDDLAELSENTGAGNEGEFPCGCRIAMRRNLYNPATKERKLSATRYPCSLHGATERMLEALEVLLGAADDVFPPQAYKAERKQARAVIREARGE